MLLDDAELLAEYTDLWNKGTNVVTRTFKRFIFWWRHWNNRHLMLLCGRVRWLRWQFKNNPNFYTKEQMEADAQEVERLRQGGS